MLDSLLDRMRRRQAAAEAASRRARYNPSGKLLARPPALTRAIHDRAILRVQLDRRAEAWVTYTAAREEFLNLRAERPDISEFVRLCDPDALCGYVAFRKRAAPRRACPAAAAT